MLSTYAATQAARNPMPAMVPVADRWLDPLAPMGAVVRLGRNTEFVAQDEPSAYCYQIVSGCVRTAMVMEDGRRQIGEFLFAGDLLGYETDGRQPFAASTVGDAVLRRFRRCAIDQLAARDPDFDGHLRQYLTAQLRTARNRLALLGRGTAVERIVGFLREMQGRLSDGGATDFELPMKLVDVADYLGLALETVCRGMADLRKAGAIGGSRTYFVMRGGPQRVLH
jgi:CRP/FNR family nitrogen fixation transcriptional regulator